MEIEKRYNLVKLSTNYDNLHKIKLYLELLIELKLEEERFKYKFPPIPQVQKFEASGHVGDIEKVEKEKPPVSKGRGRPKKTEG